METRKSGILMHISSLPSEYGIGSFGRESFEFIDFLVRAKHSVWEILPLGQTSYGDSPYSSLCSYSYNPYFISLDTLVENKLLKKAEVKTQIDNGEKIDYGRLYFERYKVLRKAFERFDKTSASFVDFVKKGDYYDYALYMAIKERQGSRAYYEWEDKYKFRNETAISEFAKENQTELLFWQFLQYEAKRQWQEVLNYARKNGITIVGDVPLYVARDSVEVWANPHCFKLDKDLNPTVVAGVPPDYFSATGQLWGNPVYDYEEQKKDEYDWWRRRFEMAKQTCDVIRIDHFRGFDRFYEVPFGAENAIVGEWATAHGREVLKLVGESSDKIIAEDLGTIDEGVKSLLEDTGYSGMRILSFGFGGDKENVYLPENIIENSVAFTGTHDNDTFMGLLESMTESEKETLKNSVEHSCEIMNERASTNSDKAITRCVIRLGYKSKARIFILPLADALALDSTFRMNIPGTPSGNWQVRFSKKHFTPSLEKYLALLTTKYGR